MAEFLYKASDNQGKFKTGIIVADNLEEATEELRKKRLQVKEIRPTDRGFNFANFIEKAEEFINRISLKDKVFFTRQLSTIISAGIPLLRALYIQEKQTNNKKFKKIIQSLIKELEGGNDFSKALVKFPEAFDDFYVSLVKAGEVSGSLDESLERLAEQLEKNQTLMGKIKSALVLPAFTFLVMIGVIVVMLIYAIPQLTVLFNEEGVELPLATKFMIFLSDFILNYWYVLLIGISLGVFVFVRFIRTEDGRKIYDKYLLILPIFGPLFRKIYLERFARNLGTMLQDGVPVVTSIKVVADTLTNVHYHKSALDLIPQIEKGRSFTKATSQDRNFPFLMVQMISVGEESGSLDNMLLKIATFYEEEIETTVKNLTTLLEPLIVVVIAVGVGFIGVAILGPIYGLVSVI